MVQDQGSGNSEGLMSFSDKEGNGARIFAESIIDTIREPLIVLDQDLIVVKANPAFYKKFQADETGAEGRPIYDMGGNQWDIPSLRDLLEKIIPENEQIRDFEIEHDFSAIGRRVLHLNARKISREEDKRSLILLAIEDVSEVIASRRALEKSEALYNRLVEEINSIIIEVNFDGVINFLNRFTEDLFGYSRDELIGKKLVGTILPETDSEGTDNSCLIPEIIQNPGRYYLNESMGLRKDGGEVWFSWSAHVKTDPETEDSPILMDGNDITHVYNARKRAREALEIVNSSGNAVVRLDLEKICRLVNRAFADLAEKPRQEIEGAPLADTGLSAGLIDRIERAIDKALEEKASQTLEEACRKHYLQIRVEPGYDEKGKIIGSIIILNNITQRKQAEDELQSLNKTLEERVAERTELAEARAEKLRSMAMEVIEAEERERSRIAHLLHDDLQQILAAASLRLQPPGPGGSTDASIAKARELLDHAIGKSRHLSHELRPSVLHQSDLVETLLWLANWMEEHFGLEVELEADAGAHVPENLMRFLFRAVQELLYNIVKHAESKTANIIFSRENEHYMIAVRDNGRGLDPEILHNPARTPGFGLTSIKERANYMGGDLEVESAPGRGSTFTLKIPSEG
jgi:PAS domain S-box-containing protein